MEPNEETRFAESMQRLRESRGWSQGELARRMVAEGWVNYSQMTVSRTEKLERPIRLGEALAVARVFNVSLPMMLGGGEAGVEALTALRDIRAELLAAKRAFEIGSVHAEEVLETVRRMKESGAVPANSPYAQWVEEVEGDIYDLLNGGHADRSVDAHERQAEA